MTAFFSRYATPFITGFFVISLVTGVALFFHFGPTAFREMHEILSLVLILPFAFHIWKNWRPMVSYFKHAPMVIALGLSLLACVPFFIESESDSFSGPPAFAFVTKAMTHSADDIAPLVDMTGAEIRAKLTASGYVFASPDQPLAEVAAAKGSDANALFGALFTPAS